MDSDVIKRDQIIDDYIKGRLSESDQSDFEIDLLENRETREALEYAKALRGALKRCAPELAARNGMQPVATVWGRPLAAAASVLLGVSLAVTGVLYQRVDSLRGQLSSTSRVPIAVNHALTLEPVRGAEDRQRIAVGVDESLLMRIDVARHVYPAYVVELRRAGDAAGSQRLELSADADDMLTLYLPSVDVGDYELEVSGLTNGSRRAVPGYFFSVDSRPIDDT